MKLEIITKRKKREGMVIPPSNMGKKVTKSHKCATVIRASARGTTLGGFSGSEARAWRRAKSDRDFLRNVALGSQLPDLILRQTD